MENTESVPYVFEGFRLDLARRRLTDPTGATVLLSGRAYDVLAYLVVNRARVIGKDEIMRAVWPRVVVEENNLNQAIYNLRRALGDSRESPRFIVTVAGRGYQFISDVKAESSRPMPVSTESSTASVASAGMATPSESIAAPSPPDDELLDKTSTAPASPPALAVEATAPRRSRRWLLLAGGAAAAGAAGVGWWIKSRPTVRGIPSTVAVLPFKPLLEADANAAIEFGITESLINRLATQFRTPLHRSSRRPAGSGTGTERRRGTGRTCTDRQRPPSRHHTADRYGRRPRAVVGAVQRGSR
jgi:DNA-binding winged helix-turn-helix (wHTH) protein